MLVSSVLCVLDLCVVVLFVVLSSCVLMYVVV